MSPLYNPQAAASSGKVGFVNAYRASNLTLTNSAFTAVPFTTKVTDVSSWYDPTTGVYTPQVAGYYLATANVLLDVSGGTAASRLVLCSLFKNGSEHKRCGAQYPSSTVVNPTASASVMFEANGSSEAFDIRVFHDWTGTVIALGDVRFIHCQFHLIGAA